MAKDYNKFMNKMIKSYPKMHNNRYWKEITPHIKDNAKGTVLDIGSGPGLLLRDIYLKFGSKKLVGLDLSDVMLDKARELLGEVAKDHQFELIKQHMQENPHLQNGLDLIVTSRVLRSFENLPEVFCSMYEALNSGGKIVILDWARRSIPEYEQYFSSLDDEFNDLTPSDIVRYHRNFSQYTLEDWNYILSNFGFTVVHSFSVGVAYNCIIGEKV